MPSIEAMLITLAGRSALAALRAAAVQRLGQEERRLQVQVDDLVPALLGKRVEGLAPGGAGVVDQDVERLLALRDTPRPAPATPSSVETSAGSDTQVPSVDSSRAVASQAVGLARRDVDARALREEARGDHAADAARAAGDERGAARRARRGRSWSILRLRGRARRNGGAGSSVHPLIRPSWARPLLRNRSSATHPTPPRADTTRRARLGTEVAADALDRAARPERGQRRARRRRSSRGLATDRHRRSRRRRAAVARSASSRREALGALVRALPRPAAARASCSARPTCARRRPARSSRAPDAGAPTTRDAACVDERLREKEFGILDRLTQLGIRAQVSRAGRAARARRQVLFPPAGRRELVRRDPAPAQRARHADARVPRRARAGRRPPGDRQLPALPARAPRRGSRSSPSTALATCRTAASRRTRFDRARRPARQARACSS